MQINSDLLTRLRNNDRTLVELSLEGLEESELNEFDIKLLQEALVENTTLTSLSVSWNQIGDVGAAVLAQNTTLTSLDVSYNEIGAAGAAALAQNTTLTSLDMGWNQIGAAGAAALAQNTTLTSLHVDDNEIGDAGAAALAQNTTLASLDVTGNQIGAAGAAALAQNTTLTSLNVSQNEIGTAGTAALAQNTTLTSLNVSNNEIGDADAAVLAQNTTLTSLNVSYNCIGAAGAAALAQNTTLTSLNVSNNKIDEETDQRLQQVIANNCYQQQSRRDHFIQTLVTLAWDKANPHSQSLWHRLTPEIILLIFSFIDFRSAQSIGKSRQQVYYCATFILNYIREIKAALQQGNGFTVQERLNQPLSSATRFTLLFKSVTPQERKSKKHRLEAEKPGAKKKKDASLLS